MNSIIMTQFCTNCAEWQSVSHRTIGKPLSCSWVSTFLWTHCFLEGFIKCWYDAMIFNVLLHSIGQCYRQCYQRYWVITNRLDVLVKGRWMPLWLQPAVDTHSGSVLCSSVPVGLWGEPSTSTSSFHLHERLWFWFLWEPFPLRRDRTLIDYLESIWSTCPLSENKQPCCRTTFFRFYDVLTRCEMTLRAVRLGSWQGCLNTTCVYGPTVLRYFPHSRHIPAGFHLCKKDPAQHGI